jgi:hypothetical protein
MAVTKGSATTLNMTRVVVKVRLIEPGLGGGDYRTDDLDETGLIEVYGTQLVDHADGSHTNCFIVMNKRYTLVPRSMSLFSVAETRE